MEETKTNTGIQVKVFKIVGIGIGLMLLSAMFMAMVSSPVSAEPTTQANLTLIHEELVKVETMLSQGKSEQFRLQAELTMTVNSNNSLREKRETLILQSNEAINAPLGL